MEFHERMGICHALHTFWNPISEQTVEELIAAVAPPPGARLLDIACGTGELLARFAGRYDITGVGVDVSPWALERARARGIDALTFVQCDGAQYRPDAPFDVVLLVGASWIWQGYSGTLRALRERVRPGGLIWFGEPYWKTDPPPDYCEAAGLEAEAYTTLDGLRETIAAMDMRLVHLVGSSEADWDRYEMRQSLAVDRWVEANPDHPEREEVLAAQEKSTRDYLRWGREAFGFVQLLVRA